MIIKKITLINFRNHKKYQLDCNKDTTLILGPNGSGKTSVLEAIYILTRGKSFRAVDSEIIKRDATFYRIELEYSNGEKSIATFDGENKNFIILDKKVRRLPKKNKYPLILFVPSDLNLITHSPSRRRDYFDKFFSQLNESYSQSLTRYEKALRQRNELLKNNTPPENLFSWNLLLAKYGILVTNCRQEYIRIINEELTNTYRSIAKNKDEVIINYSSEVNDYTEAKYLKKLEANYERDCLLGHTSFGVHRDDYIFLFNQKEANGSASRGETRSIILALKFIEAKLIYDKLRLKPIILLDDVFSELDNTRRQSLIDNFRDNQVIITSVEAL